MAIIDEEIFFFSERSDSDFNSFLDSSNPKQNLFKINNTDIPQSSSANQLVYLSQPTHKNWYRTYGCDTRICWGWFLLILMAVLLELLIYTVVVINESWQLQSIKCVIRQQNQCAIYQHQNVADSKSWKCSNLLSRLRLAFTSSIFPAEFMLRQIPSLRWFRISSGELAILIKNLKISWRPVGSIFKKISAASVRICWKLKSNFFFEFELIAPTGEMVVEVRISCFTFAGLMTESLLFTWPLKF